MHVCMCVCMYVMYVCNVASHVSTLCVLHVCVCMHECMHVMQCMYVSMGWVCCYVMWCDAIHVCMHACNICMYVCMYVGM